MNPDEMSTNLDAARARRYLLGQATEEERSAIERAYFGDDEAVDSIAAAEDDLIEDYLADQLTSAERSVFERDYLSAPHHRRRVETIRELIAAASRRQPGRATGVSIREPVGPWARDPRWLALAAAIVMVVGASFWMLSVRPDRRATVAENSPPATSTAPPSPAVSVQPPSAPPAPKIFAVSLSPATVRSAAATPGVTVPAGTEVLVVQLEGDGTRLESGRASIRTVSGADIWKGAITSTVDVPPGVIARLDVPAERLPADDYVVTLVSTDGRGAGEERGRYFLRVRAR